MFEPNLQSGDHAPMARDIPNSPEAERGVISCLLQGPELVERAMDSIGPEEFYDRGRRIVFRTITDLSSRDIIPDIIALTTQLKDRRQLEAVGGPAELLHLMRFAPSPGQFAYYAKVMRTKFVLRRIIETSNATIQRCYDSKEAIGDLLDCYENDVLAIRQTSEGQAAETTDDTARGLALRFSDRASQWMVKRERFGWPTGLLALENFHLRIYPTQRLIIAGEPNVGKSTVASQVALNVARFLSKIPGRQKVGVISLEDGADRWTDRAMSNLSGVPLSTIRDGAMSEHRDLPRIQRAVDLFSDLPLIVREFGSLTTERLAVVVRQMAKEGCAVVVIDYLQLLRCPQANDARQRVGEAISVVMELAIDLKISIWAISSLRKLDGRKPTMDDLKESGDIAYSATEIIALSETERGDARTATTIEAHILKQKDGPKGTAQLWLHGPVFRVEDPNPNHEQE